MIPVIPRITSQLILVELTNFMSCLMEYLWVEIYKDISVSDP